MLDFIKFQLNVSSPEQLKERIPFKGTVSMHTGEVDAVYKAQIENLNLILVGNRLIVSGSMHKYYNRVNGRGDHNHDDFTFAAFCYAIQHLADKLGEDIFRAVVINLEVGVNILMTQNVTSILDNCVVSHQYDLPSTNKVFGQKGRFIVFNRKEYRIKVYDKGRQYSRPDQILRVELKFKTRAILQKIGIWELADLLKGSSWSALAEAFLERADKLLIVNSIDTTHVPNIEDRIYLLERLNPLFWSRTSSLTGFQKRKQRMKFLKMLNNYDFLNLKDEIMVKSIEKIETLFPVSEVEEQIGHYVYLHKRNVA